MSPIALPDTAVPEPIADDLTGAQTLRIVPQTTAQLAAEWAELLARRRAAADAGARFFGMAAGELGADQEGA